MRNMDSKRWFLGILISAIFIFLSCGLCIYIIDPYFHYRRPSNGLIYGNSPSERYINDGIISNFDYDAIITGTSMIQNFKVSEFNSLFGLESVKLPMSGGTYREVDSLCKRALSKRPDIQVILRGLDLRLINADKDAMQSYAYPEYLYNDNRLDDINYLLDKHSLLQGCGMNVIMATIRKREPFDFDNYANWNNKYEFGKDAVLSSYERPEKSGTVFRLSEAERTTVRGNIEQNVTATAKEYPDTRFILFFTPYSICYWDVLSQEGRLTESIQMQEEVIELLLPYENIELYSFCDNFELVCNLDNYMDMAHYSEDVNSQILQWILEGEYRITEDNFQDYLDKIMDFYGNYDYDSIYE